MAELSHFRLGDGIFLQSLVLCPFSMVSESAWPEDELAAEARPVSNRSRASEVNVSPRSQSKKGYDPGPDTSTTITAMRLRVSSGIKPRSISSIFIADLGGSRFLGGL
jgi:hypothetical protein